MGFAFVCLCQKDFNSRLVGMIIQLDARSSNLEYQSYLQVLEKNWSVNIVLYNFPLYSLLVNNL
jgi:hypothetical protein